VDPERQPVANMKIGSSTAVGIVQRCSSVRSASSTDTVTAPLEWTPARRRTSLPAFLTGPGTSFLSGLEPAGPLDLNQALADRVQRGVGAVEDLQLLVHVADVVAHRLLADLQPVGDLLVGHAGRDQPQDLELAGGQPVVELLARAGAGQHVEHAVGDR